MGNVTPKAEAVTRGARMLRTALGPDIATFLEDHAVVEVMLNPDGRLWIDRLSEGLSDTGATLLPADGERIIRLVAHHVGAEVHSGAPRVIAEGMTLIERRNVMEFFRDQAAEHFARHTGSHWHPRNGSMVNHRTLTAAMIDSRDFIAAKRRADMLGRRAWIRPPQASFGRRVLKTAGRLPRCGR